MAKVRTTLTIDESVLRAVKLRAAAKGTGESRVIEDALRRDLKLDILSELWSKADALTEQAATDLALEAQKAARRSKPNTGR